MPELPYEFEHLRIDNFKESGNYSASGRPIPFNLPQLDRATHGQHLLEQYRQVVQTVQEQAAQRDSTISEGEPGFYVQFEGHSNPNYHLYGTLGNQTQGIRPASYNVIKPSDTEEIEQATVFVPNRKSEFFTTKIENYLNENISGNVNQKFAESINKISTGLTEILWTDVKPLPAPGEVIWWEVWTWQDRTQNVIKVAERLGLRIATSQLQFPELEVLAIQASKELLGRLILNSDGISELRSATDTPEFFTGLTGLEQYEWINDFAERIQVPPDNAPSVCLLDTGINTRHPLLEPATDISLAHAYKQAWATHDHDGHGTEMAGCIVYQDLMQQAINNHPVQLSHFLESVKILPPDSFPENEPQWYGSITKAAASLPEIATARTNRLFCMGITSRDVSGERPTTWSSSLDQICAGSAPGYEYSDDERVRRLFIVSAGNVRDSWEQYPNLNQLSPIEDPAQAWNALTVGAYTQKTTITEEHYQGYSALAADGELSPYSRTSTLWPRRTPLKPEIVFEGGNVAYDGRLAGPLDSLSLLTTNRDFQTRPFSAIYATSAATAQAAAFAGQLSSELPHLWPETIRALMVHSADWTESMRQSVNHQNSKGNNIKAIRQYGYGIPQIKRALKSAENDVALISEAEIQPFHQRAGASHISFNEIHYYNLPWPKDVLEQIEEDVYLKITLSYFIEPAPESSTVRDPYAYSSANLRFALKTPNETEEQFKIRVNAAEREEGQLAETQTDSRWLLGARSISAGSVHCDIWKGPGVELASCGMVAVRPVTGWWKTRKRLGCYDRKMRYSLIISIIAPEIDIDLYTPIQSAIEATIQQEIDI